VYNKKDICTFFHTPCLPLKGFSEFRAQYVVNVAMDQGHKHHVFYGCRLSLQGFRFLLDLASAEQDQPVSSGAATLPHSLGQRHAWTRPLFLVGKAGLEDDLWRVCFPFMNVLK
jgi:hypothetical protein